jgi:1-acyl-sn-glycerol-3-phosphate acyltransferase
MLFRITSRSFHRLGAVPASPKNAMEIFARKQALAVFPGGEYETFRPYRERYVIDFRRRTGFARLALQARVPITPIVTVGSHELFFILSRGETLGRWLHMKKFFRFSGFPISFGLPFGLYLGPLPSPMPLPAKITAQVLEPVHLWRREHDHPAFKPAAIDDHGALREMALVVQTRMQTAMSALAEERRFPIIG